MEEATLKQLFPLLSLVTPVLGTLFYYSFIAWIATEVLFAAVVYFGLLPSLQKYRDPAPYDLPPLQLIDKVLTCVDSLANYSHVQFFEGFFCGADLNDLRIDNYRSFLAWVMFASTFDSLDMQQRDTLEDGIAYLQKRYDLSMPDGFNASVRHVGMTVEPFQFTHRPFLLYLIIGLKNVLFDFVLLCLCYQRLEHHGVKYWYRRGKPSVTPLVVFHGITTGWSMYLLVMMKFGEGRPVFLMDLDAIKINSLVFNMPSCEDYSRGVMKILDKHNISHVSVVGHSFGSITAAWFIKCYPDRVSHLTLLDPVSLLLSLPDVAYNFLYRKPQSLVQWVIYLFASQEITVSYALRRNFWWYKNLLWLEDVPAHIGVLVGLAGGDEVGNATAMKEYAEACHAKRQASVLDAAPISSVYVDGYSHAQMISCWKTIKLISDAMRVQEKNLRV